MNKTVVDTKLSIYQRWSVEYVVLVNIMNFVMRKKENVNLYDMMISNISLILSSQSFRFAKDMY